MEDCATVPRPEEASKDPDRLPPMPVSSTLTTTASHSSWSCRVKTPARSNPPPVEVVPPRRLTMLPGPCPFGVGRSGWSSTGTVHRHAKRGLR